jgi:hypothetical protein
MYEDRIAVYSCLFTSKNETGRVLLYSIATEQYGAMCSCLSADSVDENLFLAFTC